MKPLPISGIRSDIVPHREWAVSRWFYANPLWYYHRRSAAHEICTTGKFYQLIDLELREVCRLLNDTGLRTTPSCQGHSYPRDRFKRIWDELTGEAGHICGPGLVVKDCENDQPYLFHDPAYEVPWPSFDDFYRQAGAHQNVGYLGIVIPTGLEALRDKLCDGRVQTSIQSVRVEKDLGRELGGTLVSVRIEAGDPRARTDEWRRFTDSVRGLLESDPALRAPPLPPCDGASSQDVEDTLGT